MSEKYTCIGKGGEYIRIGTALGAGECRGEIIEVYRDTATGQLYHREFGDFFARMEQLPSQPVSAQPAGEVPDGPDMFLILRNEELQYQLDTLREEHTRIVAALQARAVVPSLSFSDFKALANEAFGEVVDHDLRGNPITNYDVLFMGAYGPAVKRLVELAVARLNGIEAKP